MLPSRHKLAACQPCLTHNYVFFSFMVFQKYESGVNISNKEISFETHTLGSPKSEVSPDFCLAASTCCPQRCCVYIFVSKASHFF